MKNFMLTALLLLGLTSFAQPPEPEVLVFSEPVIYVDGTKYELLQKGSLNNVWVKVTKFYEDGSIRETGKLLNGKHQGKWFGYDFDGNLYAEVTYQNGVKRKMVSFDVKTDRTYSVEYDDDAVAQVNITGF